MHTLTDRAPSVCVRRERRERKKRHQANKQGEKKTPPPLFSNEDILVVEFLPNHFLMVVVLHFLFSFFCFFSFSPQAMIYLRFVC